MRPIDADALDYVLGASDEDIYFHHMLEDAPTIDVMPVGWIIDRANDPERAPLYRRYAQMLYEEWQKEQEAEV